MPLHPLSSGDSDSCEARTDLIPVEPLGDAVPLPIAGDVFLGFQLVALLGTGAFAKVFLARELAVGDRPVVLKVTTRLTAEPRRLGKLRHRNVVPVYSVRESPPFQAICMPYLGRRTLADWLESARRGGAYPATRREVTPQETFHTSRTLIIEFPAEFLPESNAPAPAVIPADPVRYVTSLLANIARGVAHAHQKGVLHLDLKPANVLLTDDGEVLLLDFNLAHDQVAGTPLAGGTIPYMAPEQLDAHADGKAACVSESTDLFSLGVVAYELFTGVHPYPTPRGRPDLHRLAVERRVPPLSARLLNPAVAPSLAELVAKLLAPDPARRYPSAESLADDLDAHLRHRPLRHASNPSVMERASKWGRRNLRRAGV